MGKYIFKITAGCNHPWDAIWDTNFPEHSKPKKCRKCLKVLSSKETTLSAETWLMKKT